MGNVYLDELVELTQFIECENTFDRVPETWWRYMWINKREIWLENVQRVSILAKWILDSNDKQTHNGHNTKDYFYYFYFLVFFTTSSLSWTLSSYRKISFVALNIVLRLCLTRKSQSRKSSLAKNVYACSAMLNLLYVTWSPIDQSDIFRQWGFSSNLQHIRTFRGLLLAWSGRNVSRKSNNSYGCECQGLIVDYLI